MFVRGKSWIWFSSLYHAGSPWNSTRELLKNKESSRSVLTSQFKAGAIWLAHIFAEHSELKFYGSLRTQVLRLIQSSRLCSKGNFCFSEEFTFWVLALLSWALLGTVLWCKSISHNPLCSKSWTWSWCLLLSYLIIAQLSKLYHVSCLPFHGVQLYKGVQLVQGFLIFFVSILLAVWWSFFSECFLSA